MFIVGGKLEEDIIIVIDIIFTVFMFYTSKKRTIGMLSDALDILPITIALFLFGMLLLVEK